MIYHPYLSGYKPESMKQVCEYIYIGFTSIEKCGDEAVAKGEFGWRCKKHWKMKSNNEIVGNHFLD